MAEPLKYLPEPTETHTTAHEELEALLRTLHTSGTLRALDGFFGSFAAVTQVAVSELNEPPGRRLMGNLAVVAKALTDTEPKALESVLTGLTNALDALEAVGRGRPPGMFALFRLMRNRDTRRGLHAVTRVMQSIGEQLRRAGERAADSTESLPARPPALRS